jgi:hypothetical protein
MWNAGATMVAFVTVNVLMLLPVVEHGIYFAANCWMHFQPCKAILTAFDQTGNFRHRSPRHRHLAKCSLTSSER